MLKFIIIISLSLAIRAQDDKRAHTSSPISKKNISKYGSADYQALCSNMSGFSLYDKGKSLENVKQQDQDGLNTCYANATSLMLKSHNPSPEIPVPSYLNLAGLDKKSQTQPDDYPFNNGYVCRLLNAQMKKTKEHNKTQIRLCENGILENQTSDYQKDLLKKLYDLINDPNNSKQRFSRVFDYYRALQEKNKIAPRQCVEADLELKSHTIKYVFNYHINENETESECSKKISKHLISKKVLETDEVGSITISPEFESYLSQSLYSFLNNEQLDGKSYQENYLDLLQKTKSVPNATNMHTTPDAPFAAKRDYNKIESDKALQMGTKVNQMIFSIYKDFLPKDEEQINVCLDQIQSKPKFNRSDSIYEAFASNCHQEITDAGNSSINSVYGQCKEIDHGIAEIFRTLERLGTSLDQIQDFVLANESSALLDLLKPFCKKKHTYKINGSKCNKNSVTEGFSGLKSAKQWQGYTELSSDIKEFMKSTEGEFSYADFIQFLVKKYQNPEYESSMTSEAKQYMDLLNVISRISEPDKVTPAHLTAKAEKYIEEKMNDHKTDADIIVKQIKKGHAITVDTCGSLFLDADKQNYNNCINHTVAATGVKCVGNQLKIELTNSWGISCTDDPDKKNLFECQKDKDGISNGRSWVDFNYLSNQGIDYSIVK